MKYDITPIVQAVISLAAVAFTAIVIPYIKSRTTVEQRQEIAGWVKIAVAAAEQLYKGSGRGEEKKQYVIGWLADRNIKVDSEAIDAMIESAVYDLNKGVADNGNS